MPNSGSNWIGVMFGTFFLCLTDLDTKKIRAEKFGELRNVVLEDNGEDKMVREINK